MTRGKQYFGYTNMVPGNDGQEYGLAGFGHESVCEDGFIYVEFIGAWRSDGHSDSSTEDSGFDGCRPECMGHPVRLFSYKLTPELGEKRDDHHSMVIPEVFILEPVGDPSLPHSFKNVRRIPIDSGLVRSLTP